MEPFEWTDIDGRIGHVLVLPATRDTPSRVRISLFNDLDDYGRANCADPAIGRQIAHAILAACDEIDPPVPHTIVLKFEGSPDVTIATLLQMSGALNALLKAYGEASFNAGAAAQKRAIESAISPAPAEPIRINRWLTPADIEKHGNRWRWWSPDGEDVEIEPCTAIVSGTTVRFRRDSDTKDKTRPWKSGSFAHGDYFTPIPQAERSSG